MSDLGLASGTVKLVPYNKKWPLLFEQEAKKLCQKLNLTADMVQHVGSTSIPGMLSKPILDIAILVDSLDVAETWRDNLAELNYWYKGIEPDLPDRRFFAKGPREARTIYLHVVNKKEYDSLLRFRDVLRGSPELIKEYSELKKKLALAHKDNRDLYTRAKHDFIRGALMLDTEHV